MLPGTPGLPLSPFAFERCVVLALRPEPTTLGEALALQPMLARLADDALAAGGRIYLSSFALAGEARARQLGDGAATLAVLKQRVDAAELCNRGNLFGWRLGL